MRRGFDLLVIQLGNGDLIEWVLCWIRLLLTYNVISSLDFNASTTLDFNRATSFLAYQEKQWIKTTKSYPILHCWLNYFLVFIKDKFFLLVFTKSNLWHSSWFAVTLFTGFSLHQMDFKVALTHESGTIFVSCVLDPKSTLNYCLEDSPLWMKKTWSAMRVSPSSTSLVKSWESQFI